MTSKIVPRFRGRAFQEGAKWTWELLIHIGPIDAIEPIVMGPKSPNFLNKDSALSDLKVNLPLVIRKVCEVMNLPDPKDLIDLNLGQMTTLEEVSKPIKFGDHE